MTEEISIVSESVHEEQREEVKEETQEAEEPEEPVEQEQVEQEVKRGRGRPKGALGKKKEKRNEDFILDVSFDEKPSRKRVKKIKEEEPLSPIIEKPIPKPKRKVVMKTKSEAPPQEEPMTYLEVLTRGLRAAESQHKARKVATYDNFFRY